MTGYRMDEAEAARDLGRLATTLAADRDWDLTLAGIELHYGRGRIDELGDLAAGLGARRVFLVSDPGVTTAGHVGRARRSLEGARLEVAVFDEVRPNPSSDLVARGTEQAASFRPDLFVGLGGGSALDAAKAIDMVLTNGGEVERYWGFGKTTVPLLPAIGVPTTAGTGSEAQSFTLISDPRTHRKMACGALDARFRHVVLDPDLATTTPRPVTALAGMDALSHALESLVSRERTDTSTVLARLAWSWLEPAFADALDGDERAVGAMLIGAHLAGAAIEQSMLGAAHAAANPLTARHGVPHGAAVGLMLPHVMRFNGPVVGSLYAGLLGGGADDATEALAARVESLRRRAGLPARLSATAIPSDDLPTLADAATEEWTGEHNPRPVGRDDFLALYEAAY